MESRHLQTTVVTSWQAAEALQLEWNGLFQTLAQREIFSTFGWCQAWWRTVGGQATPRIILAREGGHLVGLGPFAIVNRRVGPLNLRALQWTGGPQGDYLDVLVNNSRPDVFQAIFQAVEEFRKDWDFMDLWHVSDRSPNWESWRRLGQKEEEGWSRRFHAIAPFADLAGTTAQAFLAGLPKGLRYDLRRGERELASLGELRVIEIKPSDEEHFSRFWNFLDIREALTGRSQRRDSRVRFEAFYKNLLASPELAGQIRFLALCCANRSVAYHFGFQDTRKAYYYKPAFDPDLAKSSPGKVLLWKLLEDGCNRELQEFDFLLGDEAYKGNWTQGNRRVYAFTRYRPSLRGILARIAYGWVKPWLARNGAIPRWGKGDASRWASGMPKVSARSGGR